MARRKKILMAKQGIPTDQIIENQETIVDETPSTETPVETPQYKKFKLGSRTIDLTDDFYKNLDDELRLNGHSGNGVAEMMSLIKSGGIEGIDEGGNFYGTDIGGTETNTRRNRAWGIGKSNIRDRQDAIPGLTKSIWSVYDRMNTPSQNSAVNTYDLNNDGYKMVSKYAYNGQEITPEYWNSITQDERWNMFSKALGGYGAQFANFGEYDDKIHLGTNQQFFDNMRKNYSTMQADWDLMKETVFKDGKIDNNELNNFYSKYGINVSQLFGGSTLTAEQQAELDAQNKKAQEEALKAREEGIKGFAATHNMDGRYKFEGTDDDDYTDMQFWRRYQDDTHTNLFTGYQGYEGWNPYSHEGTSGHWVNGIYRGDGKTVVGDSEAEKNDYRNLIAENERIWGNRFNNGQDSEKYRQSEYARKIFGSRDWVNFGSQFSQGGNKLYAVSDGGLGSVYKYDVGNGKFVDGDLSKNENGTITFTSKDGSVVRNLGLYKEDKSKLNYHLQGYEEPSETIGATPITKDSIFPIIAKRKGGKIDMNKINKYQFGGRTYAPVSDEQVKQKQLLTEQDGQRSATTAEVFGGDDIELTFADKAQLASLGLDLAGLISGTVVPVYGGVAASVAGAGSSLSTFAADVSRDGLDWGDAGSLAMNLGLDLATAIPGFGNAAKFAKLGKVLKKSAKALQIGFMAAGASQGIEGLKAWSEKGAENMSLDDWQKIMSGLQVMSGGTRMAAERIGSKVSDSNFTVNYNGKTSANFKSESDAKAFYNKHGEISSKQNALDAKINGRDAEMQGLEGDALSTKQSAFDKDVAEARKEIQDLTNDFNKFKNADGTDVVYSADAKFKKSGFGYGVRKMKGENGYRSPIGQTDQDVKVYKNDERVLLDKGEGNWIQRKSRDYINFLRGGNNTKVNQGSQESSTNDPNNQNVASEPPMKLLGEGNRNTNSGSTADVQQNVNNGQMRLLPEGSRPYQHQQPQQPIKQLLGADNSAKNFNNNQSSNNPKLINASEYNISRTGNRLPDNRDKSLVNIGDNASVNNNRRYLSGKNNNTNAQNGGDSRYMSRDEVNKLAGRTNDNGDNYSDKEIENIIKNANPSQYRKIIDMFIESVPENQRKETLKRINQIRTGKYKKNESKTSTDVAKTQYESNERSESRNSYINSLPDNIIKQLQLNNQNTQSEGVNRVSSAKDAESKVQKKSKMKAKDRRKANREENNSKKRSTVKKPKRSEWEYKEGGILKLLIGGNTPTLAQSILSGKAPVVENPYNDLDLSYTYPQVSTKSIINPLLIQQDTMDIASTFNQLFNKDTQSNPQDNTNASDPIVRSSSDNGVETGQNWKKIGGFMKQMANPANLRLANTLFTNQKIMDQLKNSDKPTNNDSISLQRIKNQGLSNIQPQLQSIDQQLHNASSPMYSDAKLEAARHLSANSLAGQQKQQLYGQLSNQNTQIDASNQQISQQEALQNAQIQQQNIAKQDANKQWLLSNKMGLINSTGSALSNRLLEIEKAKQAKLAQERALDEQDLNIRNQELYRTMLNDFKSSWDVKAKAAGKSWSDFYATLSDADKKLYNDGERDFQNNFKKKSLENRRNMLNSYQLGFFSSGGKMSLAEKKELEKEKAKHKSQIESDKAFNKLILESKKDHNKMLTLLSKDMKETIKNILKK